MLQHAILVTVLLLSVVCWMSWAEQAPVNTATFVPNEPARVFTDLSVNYDQFVNGARVRITGGLETCCDTLYVKYTGASIQQSYDAASGTLRIIGRATGYEYEKILESVYFLTSSRASTERQISWNLGANVVYASSTGHYYEWINSNAWSVIPTWTKAAEDCSGRTHLGLTGYLTTITSQTENSLVCDAIANNQIGWVGASDYRSQNTWRWVTGPEGTQDGGLGLRFYYKTCTTYTVPYYYYWWYLPWWYRSRYSIWYYYWGWYGGYHWEYYFPYYYNFYQECQSYWWDLYYFRRYWWLWWWGRRSSLYWLYYWLYWRSAYIGLCPFSYESKTYQTCSYSCATYCSWASTPAESTTSDYVYQKGLLWYSTAATTATAGYTCEYGGLGVAPKFYDMGLAKLTADCGFYLDKEKCNKYVKCSWNSFTSRCELNKCLTYNSPSDCRAASSCEWDTDSRYPNTCETKFCFSTYTSQATCDSTTDCKWMVDDGVAGCQPRTCPSYSDSCSCSDDSRCFWDSKMKKYSQPTGGCVEDRYALCPSLDILLLIQVSVDTEASRVHSQLEAIRRWLPTLSLTGTPWGSAQTASTGIRLATFMWGKPTYVSYYNKGNAPTNSLSPSSYNMGDPFSGDTKEILSELDWYQSQATSSAFITSYDTVYVEPALRLASRMLSLSGTSPARRKLVIFFSGTNKFYDSGCVADYGSLRDTYTFLVARSPATASAANTDYSFSACGHPLTTLSKYCTYGLRAFQNGVDLTAALNSMCDKSQQGYANVVATEKTREGSCDSYSAQTSCEQDDACSWSRSTCVTSNCLDFCSQAKCTQQTRCYWTAQQVCKRVTCTNQATQSDCQRWTTQCTWDVSTATPYCRDKYCVMNQNQIDCVSDPHSCIWDNYVSASGNCRENRCNIANEGTCKDNAACVWDTRTAKSSCREDRCTPNNNYTSPKLEYECGKQRQLCQVTLNSTGGDQCSEKWCVGYADEGRCDKDPQCSWDISVSPAACANTFCSQFETSSDCETGDRECKWDPTAIDYQKKAVGDPYLGLCVKRQCWNGKSNCDCLSHDQCYWTDGSCRDWQYYNTTAVDLFVLIDATSSMGGYYSSYPNGFVGTIEILRDWLNVIPLTGTPAEVEDPQGKLGFRVLFYQFGSLRGPVYSPTTKVSGSRKELEEELDWHEANFQQIGGSSIYIAQTLTNITNDVYSLKANRQKLLVVITDSAIADSTSVGSQINNLISYGVSIIAVALQASSAYRIAADVNASVWNLATSPKSTHSIVTLLDKLTDNVLQYLDNWAASPGFAPGETTGITMSADIPCKQILNRKDLCLRSTLCEWEALPVCDHAHQCPNLNCQEPINAKPFKEFTCENCEISEGVQCSYSWNKVVSRTVSQCGTAKCTELCNEQDCVKSSFGCSWDAKQGICRRKVCVYTTRELCDGDSTCAWDLDSNVCRLNKCTHLSKSSECLLLANRTASICLWDGAAVQKSPCQENPCAVLTYTDCENRPYGLCKWDFSMNPAQCRTRYCKYAVEETCASDRAHNCEWVSKAASCREKLCTYSNKEVCDADKRCMSLASVSASGVTTYVCRTKICTYTTEVSCLADVLCRWAGGTCTESYCTTLADESTCERTKVCTWDLAASPSVCKSTNCALNGPSEASCAAQQFCYWNATIAAKTPALVGGCLPKPCKMYAKPCECATDTRCFWTSKCVFRTQVGCTPTDVVIIFGVGGDLYKSVGRHPSGYFALTEMLHNWAGSTAGLTGTAANDPAGLAAIEGLRVAFIEFTSKSTATYTNSTTGGKGTFSGSIEELQDDVDWHNDNYQKPNAAYLPIMQPALKRALILFREYGSPLRKKVVLLFTDGMAEDATASIAAAKDLVDSGVEVFGIRVDLTIDAEISPQEYIVQNWLLKLLSSPKEEHFAGPYLDTIPAVVLDGTCNPNLMVGHSVGNLTKMCPQIDNTIACNQNPRCAWDASSVLACPNENGCQNIKCLSLDPEYVRGGYKCENCALVNGTLSCSSTTFNPVVSGACVANPCMLKCGASSCATAREECLWDAANEICLDKTCETLYPNNQDACRKNAKCTWDAAYPKCRENQCTQYVTSSSCLGAPVKCLWSEATTPPICLEQKCNYNASDIQFCTRDTSCTKNGTGCIIRPCLHITETACSNDAGYDCDWTTETVPPTCQLNNCSHILDMGYCDEDPRCLWDTTANQDECSGLGQTTCKASSPCVWDARSAHCSSASSCRVNRCAPTRFPTQSLCEANKLCIFTGGRCTENSCAKLNSEVDCLKANTCVWNDAVSPGACTYDICIATDKATCELDARCVFGTSCHERKCSEMVDECTCHADEDCFWSTSRCYDSRFVSCANADIAFVLDSTERMVEPMGRHRHPLAALAAMLSDWVDDAPMATPPFTPTSAGLRVGVAKAGDGTSVCGTSTSCQLTTDYRLFQADLVSLSTNVNATKIMSLDAAVQKAMTMLSDGTGRVKVLFIVAASSVGISNSSLIINMQNSGITVIGVALETSPAAYVSLLPLVSAPSTTYLRVVELNDFDTDFLDDICSTFKMFTPLLSTNESLNGLLPLPCEAMPALQCQSQGHCEYNASQRATCVSGGCPQLNCQDLPEELVEGGIQCINCVLQKGTVKCDRKVYNTATMGVCQDSSCTLYCGDATRCAAAGCVYSPVSKNCSRPVCTATVQSTCLSNPACVWDPYAPTHCRVDYCIVSRKEACLTRNLCRWVENAAQGARNCKERACAYPPEQCTMGQSDPNCFLNTTTRLCQAKPCLYSSAEECLSDNECEWPSWSTACRVKLCPEATPKDPCNNIVGCDFLDGRCQREACNYTTVTACATDATCFWTNAKCLQHCRFRYSTEAACSNPSVPEDAQRCVWDRQNSRCIRRCNTYSGQQECSTDSTCEFSINGSKSCVWKCENRYNTSSACNADQECNWVSSIQPNYCARICAQIPQFNQSGCSESPSCYVKTTVPQFVCDTKCSLRPNHKTAATCVLDTDCEWDYGSGYCVERRCRHTVVTHCEDDKQCKWQNNTCVIKCGFQSTETLCQTDPTCYWHSSVEQCQQLCDYITTEAQCKSFQRCEWDDLKQYCYTDCPEKHATQQGCDDDKNCGWDWATASCQPLSCDFDTQKECQQDNVTLCRWTPRDNRTVDTLLVGNDNVTVYDLAQYSGCNVRRYYQAIPGRTGDVNVQFALFPCDTKSKCTTYSSIKETLQQNTATCGCKYLHSAGSNQLLWPPFPARLSNSPSATGWAVPSNAKVTLYVQDFTQRQQLGRLVLELECPGACRKVCSEYRTMPSCNNPDYTGGDCAWDPLDNVCREACKLYDETTCENATHCQWFGKAAVKCQMKCARRGFKDPTECNSDPLCAYSNTQGTCFSRCSQLTTNASCSRESGECYFFNDKTCRPDCNFRAQSEAACDAAGSDCLWDPANSQCNENCNVAFTAEQKQQCSQNYQCSFLGGKCVTECKWRKAAKAECNADPDCMWDVTTNNCQSNCSRKSTDTACEWSEMCDWVWSGAPDDPNLFGVCRLACEYYPQVNQPRCDGAYGGRECRWDAPRAMCYRVCSKTENYTECVGNPTCKWQNSRCMDTCSILDTAEKCSTDNTCGWSGGKCNTLCNLYPSEAACATNSRCEWQTDTCQNTCGSLYKNESSCNTDLNCLWNRLRKECVKDCDLRATEELCVSDRDTCYTATSANGTTEICTELTLRGPISSTGTYKIYTTETQMNSTMWESAIVINPTKTEDGSVTFSLGGAFHTFRAGLGVSDTCTVCRSADVDGVDMYEVIDGKAVASFINATCLGGAKMVTIDISQASKLSLVAKPRGNPLCDIAMWAMPRICVTKRSNATCVRQCKYRYSSETKCQLDPDCMWDAKGSVCRGDCHLMDQEQCLGDAMCEYNAYLETPCRRRCSNLVKGACVAETYCGWDGSQCYKLCEQRHGAAECDLSSVCEWKGPRDGTEGSSGTNCYRSCTLRAGMNDCVSEPNGRCKWNNKSNTCRQKCEYNSAGYASCVADSQCNYAWKAGVCEFMCEFKYTREFDCRLEPRCMWNPVTSTCVKSCDVANSTSECLAAGLCDVRDSSCIKRCPYRYMTELACVNDGECEWQNTSKRCNTKCKYAKSQEDCRMNYQCEWDNSFTGTCSMNLTNRQRCGPVAVSAASCKNYGCCFGIVDGCANDAGCPYPFCYQSVQRCQASCQYKYHNQTECATDESCAWNTTTKTCKKACSRSLSETECTRTDMCEWTGRSCIPQCGQEHDDMAACNADASCMWNNLTGSCTRPCSEMTQAECWANAGLCAWQGGRCAMTCPQKYTSPVPCDADDECMWDPLNGKCSVTCSSYTDQASCSVRQRCLWRRSEGVCLPLCSEYPTARRCSTDKTCEWAKIMNPSTLAPQSPPSYKCASPCSLRYSQAASCDGDIDCMWEAASSSCKAACARVEYSTFAYNAEFTSQCLSSPLCELDRQECDKKCSYRHAAESPCNLDPECVWNGDLTVCQRKCNLTTTRSQCIDAPMCEWSQSGKCQNRCPYRYFTNTTCLSDQQCDWNRDERACQNRCDQYLDPTNCSAASSCWWSYLELTCYKRCNILHESEVSCDLDDNCIFDHSSGICRNNCSHIVFRAECLALSSICTWRKEMCQPTCYYRHEGLAPDCDRDSLCMWDVRTKSCRPTCRELGSAGNCAADTMCQWRNDSSTCQKVCVSVTNATECSSLSFCDYSPFSTSCKKACVERYPTRDACSDEDCMWSNAKAVCSMSCERLSTSDTCSSNAECLWDPSTLQVCAIEPMDRVECGVNIATLSDCSKLGCCFAKSQSFVCFKPTPKCRRSCALRFNKPADCEADSVCQWDPQRGMCTRQCDVISSLPVCVTQSMCEWVDGACQSQCPYRYLTEPACNNNDACMWSSATSICRSSCERHNRPYIALNDRMQNCSADSVCVWIPATSKCEENCHVLYLDELRCSSNTRCMWDRTEKLCREQCTEYTTPTVCALAGGMCEWNSATRLCEKLCQFRYNDSAHCSSDPQCYWDTTSSTPQCLKACDGVSSVQGCMSRKACNWVNYDKRCVLSCPLRSHNATLCSEFVECEYNPSRHSCRKQCAYQYVDQASCEGDSMCMWDLTITPNVCKRSCSLYDLSEFPGISLSQLQQKCEVDTMCTWNYAVGTCMKECNFRQSLEERCENELDCMWNPLQMQCNRRCSLLDNTSCTTAAMCKWNLKSQNCTMKCRFRYENTSTCEGDHECDWDARSGKCRDDCNQYTEEGDEKSCRADSMCYWNSSNAKCQMQCDTKYPMPSNSGDCARDPLCMYDTLKAMCKSTCTTITDKYSCDRERMCRWHSTGFCRMNCEFMATDPVQCRAIDRCMWDFSSSTCRRTCAEESIVSSCNTDTMCRFDDTAMLCKVRCIHRWTVDQCNSEPRCEYNSSLVAGCADRCAYRYSMQDDCSADTSCFWDGKQCTKACDRYLGSQDCQYSHTQCEWTVTSCRRKCRYAHANNEMGCRNDDSCMWNRQALICATKCDDLLTSSLCSEDPMCQWKSNRCEIRCSFRYNTSTTCNGDSQCEWIPHKSQCRNYCGGYANVPGASTKNITDMCASDSFCTWNGTSCISTCTIAYTDQKTCDSQPRCMWDDAAGECKKTCSLLESEVDCSARSMCEWKSAKGVCAKKCAYKYANQPLCEGDPDCMWSLTSNLCTPSCTVLSSRSDCLLDSMCTWFESNSACRRKCGTFNSSYCRTVSYCDYMVRQDMTLNGSARMDCRMKCEITYAKSTASTCDEDLNCMFDIQRKVCTKSCGRYVAMEHPGLAPSEMRSLCLDQYMCTMQSDAVCQRACFNRYSTPTSCSSDSWCFWDSVRKTCTKACSKVDGKQECSRLAVCEWAAESPTTGNCNMQCSYRYAGEMGRKGCREDRDCQWDDNQTTCVKSCNYYERLSYNDTIAKENCNLDSLCDWDDARPDGDHCQRACEAKYTQQAPCEQDMTCMWDSGTRVCTLTCANLEQESLCVPHIDCRWKAKAAQPCKLLCPLRRYNNNSACDADPECMWDYWPQEGEANCRKRCTEYAEQGQCDREGDCEWRETQGCVRKCASLPTQSWCASDTTCLWNVATAMCTKKCELLYTSRLHCYEDARCMWDDAAATCRRSCTLSPVSDCSSDTFCEVQASECRVKCRIHYTAESPLRCGSSMPMGLGTWSVQSSLR